MRLTDRIRRILAGVGAALLFIKGWLVFDVYVGERGWALAYFKGICLLAFAFAIIFTLYAESEAHQRLQRAYESREKMAANDTLN
jgi:hypothetical protein